MVVSRGEQTRLCVFFFSPSPLHDVLVYQSIAEDVFVEELIGEEHQQRGDRFKQDAICDVTTGKDRCI